MPTRTAIEKRSTAAGTYWRSPAPRASLREALRNWDTSRIKTASLGGDQEQGFEQSFSSLAYSYLKDKAPRLLDFIVGFQLVDRNEDNTKAVGIFGFKVGDLWLYAPVFFLNGDLKGHELLYIKNQDMFVPLKENWVNNVISRRPHLLGEPSEKNTQQLGGLMPNLSRLSNRSMLGKYSHDIAAWAEPALPLLTALMTKKAAALYGCSGDLDFSKIVAAPARAALAAIAAKLDLAKVAADVPAFGRAFRRLAQSRPHIKRGFDRFYGPDFLTKLAELEELRKHSLVKTAPTAETGKLTKGRQTGPKKWLLDDPTPAVKNAGLEIIALDVSDDTAVTQNLPELTDAERERLLKDTVLIRDERDPHAVSVVFNTQVATHLANPSETGIYDVLEKPGSFDEMLVIVNPLSGRGRENFTLVVRKNAPANWKNIDRTGLWTKPCDCPVRADWNKYVEGLSDTKSLKKGGVYLAVDAKGSGTCAFEVLDTFGDSGFSVSWKDYCERSPNNRMPANIRYESDYQSDYNSWRAKLHLNSKNGSKMVTVNGEVYLPDSYKILELKAPPKPRHDDTMFGCMPCSVSDSQSEESPIEPGNLVDVQTMLVKKSSAVALHDTGFEIHMKSPLGPQRLAKKAALISLVRDHGIREAQAREMLKEAAVQGERHEAATFRVKYANPFLQPGPSSPAFPAPWTGTEQHGPRSTPSIYPQEEHLPVDELSSAHTDPSVYDPFYEPDQNAMGTAQQAAAGGQKEVFDTTMIAGMLKSVRQDSLVDRYLGDLMKALNSLGRILFMFWWHQEEFEDRYSKEDLPELEDGLRNAFESLGDITLFLKEKTVEGAISNVGGAGVGKQSEPDITEVARN